MNTDRQIEKELANRFQLEDLKSGYHVIRNDKGWRENEIIIQYIWLVTFDRSFSGKGGILNIKYEPSEFREINNKEKLTKLIFTIDEKGKLDTIFQEDENDGLTPYKLDKVSIKKRTSSEVQSSALSNSNWFMSIFIFNKYL